ncbi:hypothetical protein LCGC14_0263550 [marine sediment metagenome]|uniref:Uncharacterized protein n=1 Tax=marine sediment metagenome TaxID=412755 RepID=A0A0F9U1G8_9ZZZZ
MEGLVGGLIGIVIVQFSLLWYKIGKVEQKVKDLNSNTPKEEK